MLDLGQRLDSLTGATVLWLGLGNPDGGDDAVGLRLAERLEAMQVPGVAFAGLHPEQWISRIEIPRGAHLVFLDAADFGAPPGAVAFLSADEMQTRFPQISTHRIALSTLARLVLTRGAAQAWLLGIQPASLRPGQELSPVVEFTASLLTRLLVQRFGTGQATSTLFRGSTPDRTEPAPKPGAAHFTRSPAT